MALSIKYRLLAVVMVSFLLLSSFAAVDARGKKKKKLGGGGAGAGPTCSSLGLDCSATCCNIAECAETKLDCATAFKRPYIELYIGFSEYCRCFYPDSYMQYLLNL